MDETSDILKSVFKVSGINEEKNKVKVLEAT